MLLLLGLALFYAVLYSLHRLLEEERCDVLPVVQSNLRERISHCADAFPIDGMHRHDPLRSPSFERGCARAPVLPRAGPCPHPGPLRAQHSGSGAAGPGPVGWQSARSNEARTHYELPP